MSKYRCQVCGHLNFLSMGSSPPPTIHIICDACSSKISASMGKGQSLSITTTQVYVQDPNLEIECNCKFCRSDSVEHSPPLSRYQILKENIRA